MDVLDILFYSFVDTHTVPAYGVLSTALRVLRDGFSLCRCLAKGITAANAARNRTMAHKVSQTGYRLESFSLSLSYAIFVEANRV